MTEFQMQVLDSDEFVLSEAEKLRILYILKKEIRYNHLREGQLHTESVAEHVYAMHSLVDYFLLLEDPEQKMDHAKIRMMTQYHDIDEIETGDIVTFEKTQADIDNEEAATQNVLKRLPNALQSHIAETVMEYDSLQSNEARFVKAIDKLEPVFHLFDDEGKSMILSMKVSMEQQLDVKLPYFKNFKYIERFCLVITKQCDKEGFFDHES